MVSITSQTALAPVTHVAEGRALGLIIIIIIIIIIIDIIDYGGTTSSMERSCEYIE
jgi:hypothetical protein